MTKMILKAYKIRIYPNNRQIEQIEKTFGCCRFVYNYFLAKAIADKAGYEIVVVSSRCRTNEGMDAIHDWLLKYDMMRYIDIISKEKPPAIVYIDDRAICFDGHPENLLERIENFKPWNKRY